MNFIRLGEYLEKTHIPKGVLLSLLLGNSVPMKVDEEGYLTVALSEETVKRLLAESSKHCTDASYSPVQEQASALAERIIRQEMGSILEEAVDRFLSERD